MARLLTWVIMHLHEYKTVWHFMILGQSDMLDINDHEHADNHEQENESDTNIDRDVARVPQV